MKIAILGAGAIGCLFALRLHKTGHRVLLVQHRKTALDHIRRYGIVIKEISEKIDRARINAKESLSKQDDLDLVILTVKAYDTRNAARTVQVNTSRTIPVLSLQNGLGNIETLSQRLPAEMILAGTTTEAALATGPGRLVHTGKGTTWIGEIDGKVTRRCSNIRSIFQNAGFSTKISPNIVGTIWSKAIVNCAINPVSAIARVPNGEILRTLQLRSIAEKVVAEGIAIANAKGVSLSPSPRNLLQRVLSSTSVNKSSMLQDIEAGKKTEVRELNGWISASGRKLNLPSPYNDLLAKLILGLESIHSK